MRRFTTTPGSVEQALNLETEAMRAPLAWCRCHQTEKSGRVVPDHWSPRTGPSESATAGSGGRIKSDQVVESTGLRT